MPKSLGIYTGLIGGLGRPPGGGHSNPLQDSCLENPVDRGAWWATVQMVAKESNTTERLHTQSGRPVFGYLPRGVKTYVHTRNCPCTFIATLLIIAIAWKQPRRPSVGEWINKLWDVQTMGYYSVIKRNELSNHRKTWRKRKCMLLSGRSQFGKAAYHMVPTV